MPGQWRPHDAFEHIVWIRPPWEWADYVWLDFPEAIFADRGLLYLSHRSYKARQLFDDLPGIEWQKIAGGLVVRRVLPNRVVFRAGIRAKSAISVALELTIENGSEQLLSGIKVQVCAFLRAAKEFSEYTNANKFVHTPGGGWVNLSEAAACEGAEGSYRVGWRSGRPVLDLPVIVTLSSAAERLIAISWFGATYSMIGNPEHPCMHADPCFDNIEPGASQTISGEILFFEGGLMAFEDYLSNGNFLE